MKMSFKRLVFSEYCFLVSFYIFTSYCFLPFIRKYSVISFQMPIIFFSYILLILYLILKKKPARFIGIIIISLFIIVFNLLFIYFQNYFEASINIINKIGANYSLFVATMPIIFIYSRGFEHVKKERLLNMVQYTILLTAITTIIGTYTYNSPCRELATPYNIELDTIYRSKNIGGYSFIYSLVLLSPIELSKLLKQFSIKRLILFIIFAFCIVRSEYTIAIVLLVVSTALCIIIYKAKGYALIITAIFVTTLVIQGEKYFIWIINNISNSNITISRLLMLFDYYKNDSITGDLLSRKELYYVSVNSFLKNPLFGSLFHYAENHIGGHSELLDYLGHSGIFGVIVLLPVLLFIKKFTSFSFVKNDNYLFVMYIIAFALALINPFYLQELFYVSLIIPVLL